MKLFNKIDIYPVTIVAISLIANIITYPYLPEQIPTHWNTRGIIDDYGPKMPYAFIGTIVALAMLILFEILPYLDPRKENYRRFKRPYSIIRDALITFSAGVGLIPYIASAYGINDPSKLIIGAISLLFIVFGNYMGQLKQNWYAGIKTPWTLSSETVWNKTHRLSGKLMMLSGFLTIISLAFKLQISSLVFTATTTVWAIGSCIYSYIIYHMEKNQQ